MKPVIVLILHLWVTGCVSLVAAATSSSSTSEADSLLSAMKQWGVNFSTWVGNDPCKSWGGVLCNSNNKVISLNLSSTGISGDIPKEIGSLQYLQVLDLSNPRNAKGPINSVSGDLSALEGLIYLENLNLSFNNIKLDSFPTAVFSLVNLIALKIDNTLIKGPIPTELTRLTKLEYMYLANNSFTGPLPPEYGTLVHLKEISLWNNNLNSKIPPEFGNLVNLTYLNLHECNLYGGLPPELGKCNKMRNISLYGNELTGVIPDTWSNMTELGVLWLHRNFLTKNIPEWLPLLPNLYNVSLDNNYFYGSVSNFPTQPSVKILSVTCNFLSGPIPTLLYMASNTSGNCFDGSDKLIKIRCLQSNYFDCVDFLNSVKDGSCPKCPTGQNLEDLQTCVCTRDALGGSDGAKKWKIIGPILGVGLVVLFIAIGILLWWLWRSAKKDTKYKGRYFEAQGYIADSWEGPEGVVRFNIRDIVQATDNFDSKHEIGSGGFGKVYLAELDGKKVAIKCAHLSSIQSSSSFRNEVILLSRLHHKNLVRLLGFAEEEGIQILVYEYMQNGNLHTMLFKSNTTLDWLTRLDIAIGVAHGLEYLHSFADPPVIHRDVKPSNILLDNNMVAKLADFGISRVAPESDTHFATRPAGTAGYIDPQYVLTEQLTTASDVYGFGVVLLELITGQKCIDNSRTTGRNLVEWACFKVDLNEGIEGVVDPRLGDNYPKKIFEDILRVAIDCASFKSDERPSMKAVITILDSCRWAVTPQVAAEFVDRSSSSVYTHSSDGETFSSITSHTADATNNTLSVSLLMPR